MRVSCEDVVRGQHPPPSPTHGQGAGDGAEPFFPPPLLPIYEIYSFIVTRYV